MFSLKMMHCVHRYVIPPHTHSACIHNIRGGIPYLSTILLLWQIEEEEKTERVSEGAELHCMHFTIKLRNEEKLKIYCHVFFPPRLPSCILLCVYALHISIIIWLKPTTSCSLHFLSHKREVDHNVKKALKDYTPVHFFMSKGRWLLNLAEAPLYLKMISCCSFYFWKLQPQNIIYLRTFLQVVAQK